MEYIVGFLLNFFGFENFGNLLAWVVFFVLFAITALTGYVAEKSSEIKYSGLKFPIAIVLGFIFSLLVEAILGAMLAMWFIEWGNWGAWVPIVIPYLQAVAGPIAFSYCALLCAGENHTWVFISCVIFYFLFVIQVMGRPLVRIHIIFPLNSSTYRNDFFCA